MNTSSKFGSAISSVEVATCLLEKEQLSWLNRSLILLGSGLLLNKGLMFLLQDAYPGVSLIQITRLIGMLFSITGTFLLIVNTCLFVSRYQSLLIYLPRRSDFYGIIAFSTFVLITGIMISVLFFRS